MRTWNVKVISILILVSIIYGVWFNFLDSAAYCYLNKEQEICKPIGEALGHNNLYQTWNIMGHIIPSLFYIFIFSKNRITFSKSINIHNNNGFTNLGNNAISII